MAEESSSSLSGLSPELLKHIQSADALFKEGKYDEAIVECEKGNTLNPKCAALLFTQAACYHRKGEAGDPEGFKIGTEVYTRLIEVDGSLMQAYQNRAVCLVNSGRFDEAAADVEKAKSFDAENEQTKLIEQGILKAKGLMDIKNATDEADAKYEEGNYDACIELCTKAIGMDASSRPALFRRALAYTKKGDHDGKLDENMLDLALNDYTKLVELTEKRAPEVLLNRASLHLKRLNVAAALEDVSEVLIFDPDNDYAKEFKNTLLTAIEKNKEFEGVQELIQSAEKSFKEEAYAECIEFCTQALQKDSECQAALFRRAVSNQKIAEAALAGFKNSHANMPPSPPEVEKAIEDYSKLIQVSGGTMYQVYMNRASLYMRQEEFDKALWDIEKVLELAPDAEKEQAKQFHTHIKSAIAEQKAGGQISMLVKGVEIAENNQDWDKVIESCLKILEIDVGFLPAKFRMANAYQKKGDKCDASVEKAVEIYNEILSVDPDMVECLINRGLCSLKKMDMEKALPDIKRALQLRPEDEHIKKLCEELEGLRSGSSMSQESRGDAEDARPKTPRTPGLKTKSMDKWTVADVCAMVESEGLDDMRDYIHTMKVDGLALQQVTLDNIKRWGAIEESDAKKFLDVVDKYRNTN